MPTDAALDQVVAEFQASDVPRPTPRDARLPALPGRADAVIGVRRAGKTWFLHQQVRALLDAGVPRRRILHVNLEDDRLGTLAPHDLGRLLDAWRRHAPEIREGAFHLFLDEVQNAPDWPQFVRRVLDTEEARVVVTGSSAKLLSTEIHMSMRGRSLATEIAPFSFREWLRHRRIDVPATFPTTAKTAGLMEHAFDRYLESGGFPEIQPPGVRFADEVREAPDAPDPRLREHLDPLTARRVLRQYVDVVVLRDVLERHPGMPALAAVRLARRLLSSPAAPFAVGRFHADLRSEGMSVGKNTLHDLFAALADAFLVFPVEIDARSERQRTVNPRKVYPVDTALARAFSFRAGEDRGRLLETAVYLELRRRGCEITYHRTASRREVDFLARYPDGRKRFVQVTLDLADAATREREIGALAEALPERDGADAVVVTRLASETIDVAGRPVRVVPAWRWCLEPDA